MEKTAVQRIYIYYSTSPSFEQWHTFYDSETCDLLVVLLNDAYI